MSMDPSLLQVKPGVSLRSDFPLVPSKSALLIIDVQDYLSSPPSNYSVDFPNYLFDTALPDAISNIAKLAKSMRTIRDSACECASDTNGCEIIITYLEALTADCRDISLDYKLSGPKLARLPNPSNKATFATLPKDLRPCLKGKGDISVPKTSCSVFQSTNIRYILSNLGIQQLIICGQLTDQCVMSSVRDAADLGFFVLVVEDACAALSKDDHERGVLGMKGFARTVSTEEVMDELSLFLSLSSSKVEIKEPSNDECSQDFEASIVRNKGCDAINLLEVNAASLWTPSLDSQMFGATHTLLNILQCANVDFLRFASIDISNNVRTKTVPIKILQTQSGLASTLHSVLDDQVNIAKVCMAGMPSYGDVIIPGSGISAKDVLVIKPDLNSLKILPYSPRSAMVFGTMHDQRTGELSPLCTRGLLARVLQTAKEKFGIGFTVGIELEFCLIKADKHEELVPVDTSLFASATTMNDQQDFISDVYAHLQTQTIEVKCIHSESAPGQMEIVLSYNFDVMRVADNVMHAKETIKCCAKRHGMRAIFKPKVYNSQAGNGMHVHCSLRGLRSSDPFHNTFQSDVPFSISEIGQSFLEGILCHLKGLLCLTIPSTHSFSRVGRGCWTGYAVGWQVEDKESPLRVCLNSRTQKATNVEMKLMDSTCNIHLALASILWSGLDGINKKMMLRPMLDKIIKIQPLPASLEDSLDCLRRDDMLSELLGEELLNAYITIKKAEIEYCNSELLTLTQIVLNDVNK